MSDSISIKFSVDAAQALEATNKLRNETAKLEKAWEEASDAQRRAAVSASKITAWKVLTTDVDELSQSFAKASPRAAGFAGSLVTVAKGVATAGAAIMGLGVASARMLAQAEEQENAVRRLGGAYEAVSVATEGAMSAQQALTLQGQIQASGVQVNAQQLGLLARAAREYALATGNDASQAVEKLTNAIVNNSEDALSELGLSQARATTSTQTLANMTRELEDRFRGVSPTARTLNEDLEKLPQVMANIGASAAATAAGGLRAFIDSMHGAGTAARLWRDVVEMPETQRTLAAQARSNAAAAERNAQRERTNALFREGRVRISETNIANFGDLSGLTTQERGRMNRAAQPGMWDGNSASESVNRELARIAEERLQRAAMESQLAQARAGIEEEVHRKVRKLGDAAVQASTGLTTLQRALTRTLSSRAGIHAPDAGDFSTMLGALAAPTEDELSGQDNERDKAEAAFAEERAGVRRDAQLRTRRTNRDRETRTQALAQDRSVGGGLLRGLGVNGNALETEAKLSQGYADTIIGAYSKIGDAVTRHAELVASGQETIAQAALNGTHEVTKALAMEALPRALMETAAGLAALANPITAPTAPLHFTAAAVYGSVAAGAGLVAGVTGALGAGQSAGAGAGARATGSARAASGASSSGSQENAPPVNIYLSSIVPPGPRELQSLVAAGAQAGRYNLDRRRDMIPRQVRA